MKMKFLLLIILTFVLSLNIYGQTIYFSEGFENSVPPTGWTDSTSSSFTTGGWSQNDGTSYGPGNVVEGSMAAMADFRHMSSGVEAYLTTPIIDLSNATAPRLHFYWQCFAGHFPNASFIVKLSTDGGNTFSPIYTQETNGIANEWLEMYVPLNTTSSQVVIQFVAISDYGYDNLFLDDIYIQETPTQPIVEILPDTIDFDQVILNETSDTIPFTLTNTGGGLLNITDIEITGTNAASFILIDTNTYPMGLTSLQSLTGKVAFSPADTGTFTAFVTITDDNANTYQVSLFGNAYDGILYPDFIEEFDNVPPQYWREYSGVITDTTILYATYGKWYANNFANNDSNSSSAILRIEDNNCYYWLVTPPIYLDTNKSYLMDIDIALTTPYYTYSSKLSIDDRVAFVISTDNGQTWSKANILKEWNTNTVISTGEHHTIDLSNYYGMIKIGFYTESTISNADINFFYR